MVFMSITLMGNDVETLNILIDHLNIIFCEVPIQVFDTVVMGLSDFILLIC